jgi:hypothetical protein
MNNCLRPSMLGRGLLSVAYRAQPLTRRAHVSAITATDRPTGPIYGQ